MARRAPPKLPPADDLVKLASDAITAFKGPIPELESAVGMLFVGHAFGWRVLYMIHSVATVRKYEKILGLVAKETFPERTPHSDRSNAFRVLDKVSNFWKAVKGENRPQGFSDPDVN